MKAKNKRPITHTLLLLASYFLSQSAFATGGTGVVVAMGGIFLLGLILAVLSIFIVARWLRAIETEKGVALWGFTISFLWLLFFFCFVNSTGSFQFLSRPPSKLSPQNDFMHTFLRYGLGSLPIFWLPYIYYNLSKAQFIERLLKTYKTPLAGLLPPAWRLARILILMVSTGCSLIIFSNHVDWLKTNPTVIQLQSILGNDSTSPINRKMIDQAMVLTTEERAQILTEVFKSTPVFRSPQPAGKKSDSESSVNSWALVSTPTVNNDCGASDAFVQLAIPVGNLEPAKASQFLVVLSADCPKKSFQVGGASIFTALMAREGNQFKQVGDQKFSWEQGQWGQYSGEIKLIALSQTEWGILTLTKDWDYDKKPLSVAKIARFNSTGEVTWILNHLAEGLSWEFASIEDPSKEVFNLVMTNQTLLTPQEKTFRFNENRYELVKSSPMKEGTERHYGFIVNFFAGLNLFLCLFFGLGGIFIPVLPGIILILGAVLIHIFILPGYLSWMTAGVLGLCLAINSVLDRMGSGAKWSRANRLGLWGIFLGGIGGKAVLPLTLAGMILGSLFGFFCGETLVSESETPSDIPLYLFRKLLLSLFLLIWVLSDLWVF